jgi:hypothetical protein
MSCTDQPIVQYKQCSKLGHFRPASVATLEGEILYLENARSYKKCAYNKPNLISDFKMRDIGIFSPKCKRFSPCKKSTQVGRKSLRFQYFSFPCIGADATTQPTYLADYKGS